MGLCFSSLPASSTLFSKSSEAGVPKQCLTLLGNIGKDFPCEKRSNLLASLPAAYCQSHRLSFAKMTHPAAHSPLLHFLHLIHCYPGQGFEARFDAPSLAAQNNFARAGAINGERWNFP